MAHFELRELTAADREDLLALRVRRDQAHLVATPAKSLRDAAEHPGAELRGAWLDGDAVGYAMIFPYERSGERLVNIVRLMIDERYQGRGLGRELLQETLDWIAVLTPPAQRVRISTLPDNAVALSLYRSAGFCEAGVEEGEIALYRALAAS